MEPNPLVPPVVPVGEVWPPPPSVPEYERGPAYRFKTTYRGVLGKLGSPAQPSDLREGWLQFSSEGIAIQGKAVPPAQIRNLALVFCLLVNIFIAVAANAVMEYGLRRDQSLNIRWSNIQQVCLWRQKQQVCLVYYAMDDAGTIRLFSLAFRPAEESYEDIVQAVQEFMPDRIREGRLRDMTPLLSSVPLGVFLILFTIGLLWLGSQH